VKGWNPPTIEAGDIDLTVDWPDAGVDLRGWLLGLAALSRGNTRGEVAGEAASVIRLACWK